MQNYKILSRYENQINIPATVMMTCEVKYRDMGLGVVRDNKKFKMGAESVKIWETFS